MTTTQFSNDDRFAVLSQSDVDRVGNRELAIQLLLDDAKSDSNFAAVLDGERVYTAVTKDGVQIKEDGLPKLQYEPLEEFVG